MVVGVGVVGKLSAVPAVEKPSPPALLVWVEPKREDVREEGVDSVVNDGKAEVVVEALGVAGVVAPRLKVNGVVVVPVVAVPTKAKGLRSNRQSSSTS